MSESTITLSVSGRTGTLLRAAAIDPVAAWNAASGDYAKAAKVWAGAYVAGGEIEENYRLGRTALAALTVKALDEVAPRRRDGSHGKATREDVAKAMDMATEDLNSALPGQWRIAARLYTDLGMDPRAPLTRWLVNSKPAGWGEAAAKATSEADMIAWVDQVCKAPRVRDRLGLAPLPAITSRRTEEATEQATEQASEQQASEQASEPTRGAGDPDRTVADLSLVRSNREAILTAEQALARIDWTNLTDADREGLVSILGLIDAGLS